MRKIELFISLLITLLIFNCKSTRKTTNTVNNLDDSKTLELITFLLKQEGTRFSPWKFSPNGCISEEAVFYRKNAPVFDFSQSFIAKHLEIKDSVHFNSQTNLYLNFKMTNSIVPNRKILTKKKFDELERKYLDTISINPFLDRVNLARNSPLENWLKTNCENTYYSISKPIFNETFDLAFIEFRIYYGALSGYIVEKIYAFKNGKWAEKSALRSVKW